MKLKNVTKAVTELKRTAEEDPNSPRAHNNLGLIYGKYNGSYKEAIQEFKKALELDANFGDARCNLAIAYYLVGENDLSWRQVKVARLLGASFDPGFIDALKNGAGDNLKRAAAVVDWNISPEALRLKRKIALTVVTVLVVLAAIGAGAVYFVPRAASYMRGTTSVPVNLDLIKDYLDKGSFDEAILASQTALKTRSNDVAIRNLLAQAYHRKQMWDQEIDERKKIVELNPDWPAGEWAALHNNLAVAYIEKKDYGQAMEECEKAIRFWPDNAEAYTNLGFIYAQEGDLAEAIKMHRKATEIRPSFKEAHYNLALALAESGKFGKAMSEAKLAEALGYPAEPLIGELERLLRKSKGEF